MEGNNCDLTYGKILTLGSRNWVKPRIIGVSDRDLKPGPRNMKQ